MARRFCYIVPQAILFVRNYHIFIYKNVPHNDNSGDSNLSMEPAT